jgi:outer membrane autotransporter protein
VTHAVAGNWALARIRWTLLTGCAFFVATSAVEAQTAWIGDPSANDWYTAANWDNGVPTSADDTVIDTPANLVNINGGSASTDDLVVGASQTGQLWIYNGAVLDTFGAATIGENAGSTGIVQLEDAGTEWNVTGALSVGGGGIGGLYIRDGADASAAQLAIGGQQTGNGAVEISDTGSSFTAPVIYVGKSSTGVLAVNSGGQLFSDAGFVGYYDGASGNASVSGTGSKWTNAGALYVGTNGAGVLDVLTGAEVETVDLYIGYNPTGDGEVRVSGTGALLDVTNQLAVGWGSTGLLTIEAGGHVASLSGLVGSSSDGTGEVDITGSGSRWDIAGGLRAGFAGTDNITIEAGGVLSSGFARLGEATYGTANVTVTGAGSTWDNSGNLYVGDVSSGQLDIRDGGTVDSGDSFVGYGAGSIGVVNVDGTGSNWNVTGDLTIADAGAGTVRIFDGGTVTTTGNASVGTSTGSGRIEVTTQSKLAVGGNLALGANATYVVGLDPASTSAGLIDATGSATIDVAATLEILDDGVGSYSVGSHYTILTAAGGVTGTFANTADPIQITAFLAFDAIYDTNAVYLDVIQTAQLADAATTPNQIETAEGVEGLGAGSDIYDGVYSLPTLEAAADALDQLSGEGHASFKGVHIEDSRFVREAALGRLDDSGGETSSGIWGQLYGATGHLPGDGNAATADSSTAGLVIGTDSLLGNVRLGVLAHAGTTALSIPDRNTDGSSSNYGLGIYGGADLGATALAFGAAFTHHDVSTTRNVDFAGFSDQLEASYGSATGQIFGEISHELSLGDVGLTPYGQLAYVTHSTDAFTEAGGDAALSAAASTSGGAFTTIGLRASYAFPLGEDGKVALTGGAGWRHAFADVPATENAFAGGDAFAILGTPLAEDTVALEGSLDLDLAGGLNVGLAYSGQLSASSDAQSHALKLSVGGAF